MLHVVTPLESGHPRCFSSSAPYVCDHGPFDVVHDGDGPAIREGCMQQEQVHSSCVRDFACVFALRCVALLPSHFQVKPTHNNRQAIEACIHRDSASPVCVRAGFVHSVFYLSVSQCVSV